MNWVQVLLVLGALVTLWVMLGIAEATFWGFVGTFLITATWPLYWTVKLLSWLYDELLFAASGE